MMTYLLTFTAGMIFGVCCCALLWWAVVSWSAGFKDDDHRKN